MSAGSHQSQEQPGRTGQGRCSGKASQPRQRGKLSRPRSSLGRLIQISHHAAGQCRRTASGGDVITARGWRRLAAELLIAQLPGKPKEPPQPQPMLP
ncbi:MAG TPA: hypothetical protein DDY43_06265 [Synechococcales bacterium UBA10510]|nr:hypothetical protein [Synechococcales bacterium UBA10510]